MKCHSCKQGTFSITEIQWIQWTMLIKCFTLHLQGFLTFYASFDTNKYLFAIDNELVYTNLATPIYAYCSLSGVVHNPFLWVFILSSKRHYTHTHPHTNCKHQTDKRNTLWTKSKNKYWNSHILFWNWFRFGIDFSLMIRFPGAYCTAAHYKSNVFFCITDWSCLSTPTSFVTRALNSITV